MKISRKVCDGRDCFVSVRQQIGACYRPTATTTTTTSTTDSKHLRVVSAVGAHCPGPWEDQRRSIYNSNRPAAKHNLDHYRLGVNCERLLATSRQPRSSAGGQVVAYLVVVTNNVYNTAMSVDIPRTSHRVSWPTSK